MAFYFIVYTIVGIAASSAYTVYMLRSGTGNAALLPSWAISKSPIIDWLIMLCAAAPILALVTSLFQSGIWVFATIAEILLGYMITSVLIPTPVRFLIFLLSPLLLLVIFGALWGYWYI
jgi:hypothetical protein